jgi:hypothetical protein
MARKIHGWSQPAQVVALIYLTDTTPIHFLKQGNPTALVVVLLLTEGV